MPKIEVQRSSIVQGGGVRGIVRLEHGNALGGLCAENIRTRARSVAKSFQSTISGQAPKP